MGWQVRKSAKRAIETADAERSAVVEYAQRLVDATIAEIDRADTKAALFLAASGVLIGVGASALVAGAPQLSHLPTRIIIPLILALGSALAALILLGSAAYPRGTGSASAGLRSVTYFTDVVRADDAGRLRSAILGTISDREDVLLEQLMQLSRIVMRKYLLIRVAFGLFVIVLFALAVCAAEALFG
jgi:hypothetical protein